MRKSVLLLLFLAFLSIPVLSVPVEMELMEMEQIDSRVTITVEGNAIIVNGAEGQVLEVVSLTGRKVAEYQINSPAQRIELNNLNRGCYVIKVGKVVRKVSIH